MRRLLLSLAVLVFAVSQGSIPLKADGVLVRYMNYPGWGDGLRISVGTDEQIDLLLDKLTALI